MTMVKFRTDFTHRWGLFSIVVLLLGSAWILVSRADPHSTTSGAIPAPHQGFLAPDFTLQTASGESITLSDLRGQPVLINMWATWCPPCRAEMPAMQSVFSETQAEGFVILAVNATQQDDPARAVAFAQELGLTFPILFDTDGSVTRLYQVSFFPTSYFVDREGIIQEVVLGGPMAEALLRIRARQLLDRTQPAQQPDQMEAP